MSHAGLFCEELLWQHLGTSISRMVTSLEFIQASPAHFPPKLLNNFPVLLVSRPWLSACDSHSLPRFLFFFFPHKFAVNLESKPVTSAPVIGAQPLKVACRTVTVSVLAPGPPFCGPALTTAVMVEVRPLSSVSSASASRPELHRFASHCLHPCNFQRLALLSHGASTQSQVHLSPLAPSLPHGGLSVLLSSQVHQNPITFPKGNLTSPTSPRILKLRNTNSAATQSNFFRGISFCLRLISLRKQCTYLVNPMACALPGPSGAFEAPYPTPQPLHLALLPASCKYTKHHAKLETNKKLTFQKPPFHSVSNTLSSLLVTSFKMQPRGMCPSPLLTLVPKPSSLHIQQVMAISMKRSLRILLLILFYFL